MGFGAKYLQNLGLLNVRLEWANPNFPEKWLSF